MGAIEVEKITKLIPNVLNISLQEAMNQEPALEQTAKTIENGKEVLEVALRLEGLALTTPAPLMIRAAQRLPPCPSVTREMPRAADAHRS